MSLGNNTLKVENHSTILASSRLVWSEGTAPHRVVLRKVGNEYVTHMENLFLGEDGTFRHGDFYWGHYFSQDEKGAKDDYLERCSKL